MYNEIYCMKNNKNNINYNILKKYIKKNHLFIFK